jgi:DNA invertase Pin-like site-specific DNA recombinase
MSDKIKPEHLQRGAFVYVRQSTAGQVRYHREGQQRQYDLSARARQLGFTQVVVIDEDLGRTGSGLQERPGFARLLSSVCQGLVGAVLALEASRLARNNRDWHHLIDLCALTETVIIDGDGVYDPKLLNDRLLLGLKGTMSEFELGLMRQRARQAYLQKVKRGEAMWIVPVGFVRGKDGRIEKSPDRQVQQTITMVLEKFRQLGSARQTLFWLREENLKLPHALPESAGLEVNWQKATLSRVHQILRNPCYAGAFVFGRTATQTVIQEGRLRRSSSRRYKPQQEWEVLILDHHPGYLSWAEYLENRQRMANNVAGRASQSSGAIKKGAALLSGLLRCGRCGRKLQVGYSGTRGEVGRYLCRGRRDERGSASCASMGSLRLDQAVVNEVLAAISPAGIEAAVAALETSVAADQQKRQALELALERARYEVSRARRQYDAVEPENRLVAAELEQRWNVALQEATQAEDRLRQLESSASTLNAEQKQRLKELGEDLPRLWETSEMSVELKKQILRAVLQEIVVLDVDDPAEHRLQMHWMGGVHTELRLPRNRTGHHRRAAGQDVVALVGELAKVSDDRAIAAVLNRLGYRTGQNNCWSVARVCSFRHNHGIEAYTNSNDFVSLQAAAELLGVSDTAIKTLIRKGILAAKQAVACAPWVIEKIALEQPKVQAAARAVKAGKAVPPTALGQHELTL